MATVTNLARSPVGFATADGRLAMLAPGETAEIDVPACHPAHDAWVGAGLATIAHAGLEPIQPPASEQAASPEQEPAPCPDPCPPAPARRSRTPR